MIKREKVIKGLEHCTSHDDGRDKFGGVGKCGGCPYYGHDCTDRMKKDALALLKEQHEQIDKLIDESASNYDLYYMQFSNAVLETMKIAKEALTEEEYKLFIESVQRLCEQDIK